MGCVSATSFYSNPRPPTHTQTEAAASTASRAYTIHMPSMGCVACINSVQGALQRIEGVLSVEVSLEEKGGTAQVVGEGKGGEKAVLLRAVEAAGFPGTIEEVVPSQASPAVSRCPRGREAPGGGERAVVGELSR